MRLLPLLLAALLSAACGAPAPGAAPEDEPGSSSHLDVAMPSEAVVAEPEAPAPVDRLRARWTVDSAFSADEAQAVVAAGDLWAAVTDGRVALTYVVGDVAPGEPWTVRRGAIEPGTPGRTTVSAEGARTVLDADMLAGCPERLVLVAAHEMGHALGILGHGHTGGVMTTDRVPGCEMAFLPEDLEMFEAANP